VDVTAGPRQGRTRTRLETGACTRVDLRGGQILHQFQALIRRVAAHGNYPVDSRSCLPTPARADWRAPRPPSNATGRTCVDALAGVRAARYRDSVSRPLLGV